MFSNNHQQKRSARQAGKPNSSQGDDTSLIARGTSITGDVYFGGALHVDGCIEGAVLAEADSQAVFTLSAEGEVSGEVWVPNAVINGVVKGSIHASTRLELAAQARVDGDVHYLVLEMAAGAEVNGRMVHQGKEPRQLTGPEAERGAEVEEALTAAGQG